MRAMKFLDQFFDAYDVVPLPKQDIVTIFKASDQNFRSKVLESAQIAKPWLKSKKSEAFFGFGAIYCLIANIVLTYGIQADKAYRKVMETQTVAGKVYEKVIQVVDPSMIKKVELVNNVGYLSVGVFVLLFIYYRAEVQKYDDAGSKAARNLKNLYMMQADKVSQAYKNRGTKSKSTQTITDLRLFDDSDEE